MAWTTRGIDELYDRWVAEDEPDLETQVKVIHWLMDFKRYPFPRDSAPVPGTPLSLWVADIPSTRVSLLYSIHEKDEQVVGWLLETLD